MSKKNNKRRSKINKNTVRNEASRAYAATTAADRSSEVRLTGMNGMTGTGSVGGTVGTVPPINPISPINPIPMPGVDGAIPMPGVDGEPMRNCRRRL